MSTGWLAVAAAEETAPARLDRLVNRLGAGAYRDREAASRELDALGAGALDALRRAAASADPETRRRATELIERISERVAAARILAPTTVEFNYENKPLAEAVEDFKKRTGAVITLSDPNKLHGRTITAATPGPIPFWEAIELLCRKADLHQWDGFSKVGNLTHQPQLAQQPIPGVQGQIFIANRSGRSRPQGPPQNAIVLLDGPGAALPACRAGAVRLRVAPLGSALDGLAVGGDEVVLPLQLSAEPKLRWQRVLDIRINRAVDDQGRSLPASPAVCELPAEDGEMIFVNNMLIQAPNRRSAPIGVRVVRGDKPAARLAELAGTVGGEVRLAEPLAVAADPLKAAGQSIRGTAGVVMKIQSAKVDEGNVTAEVEMHLPPDVQLGQAAVPGQAAFIAGGGLVIQGGGGVVIRQGFGPVAQQAPHLPAGTTEYQGLALEDAKGRRFTVSRGMVTWQQIGADGAVYRFTAAFKPAEAGQEPARLVFTATRPVTIEFPFLLKDVPLQ
jgi:hypothetical protein